MTGTIDETKPDHTTMDEANLRDTKVMKDAEGEKAITNLDCVAPKATQKKKRKSHRGGKKKKGLPHLSADSKGDGDMEQRGSTKHDGDELVIREDFCECQHE